MANRKLGLALGGGGAKGSAHLGVLRELERLGLEFDCISGTSIGAIVGAVAAAGYGAAAIERAFRSTTLRTILGLDPARWGLIGSDKLAEVLYQLLGDRKIEDLPIPYAAVAVDLVTGNEIVLDHGSVVEAALASASWVSGIQLALAERAIGLMLAQLTLFRLRETPPDLLLTPDVSRISMADLNHLDDGVSAGIAAVTPYADELDALRRWRLGEEAGLKAPGQAVEIS